MATTKNDVINVFHTFPMSKQILPEGLENQFFINALAQYELEISELSYDDETCEFLNPLNRSVLFTLGLMMYTNYLTRELSRLEKLSGFHGKDIQLTGNDTSKRVTLSDLQLELDRVDSLLHKQKTHAFN
jgi:hypothetical protein